MSMGDQPASHLRQLEERAGITMQELRAMDAGDMDDVTEHCRGSFNNEAWLSEELSELGDRFDRVEETSHIGDE